MQNQPPEEPLQRLAWDAAQQIRSRLTTQRVKMQTIENQANLSESQLHYFRGALENELWRLSTIETTSDLDLNGILTYANGQLQFLWKTPEDTAEKVNGMVAVLWSEVTQDSSGSPDEHHPQTTTHHHAEVDIPTPITQLQTIPLDVVQACHKKSESCEIIVLYQDAIERIDWKTSNKQKIFIPREYFAPVPSRAPSGKILNLDGTYIILHNNLTQPLQYDFSSDAATPATLAAQIPLPAPGLNIFLLMNGRFYDFEVLRPKGMAVIQEDQRLSIGTGTITSANELVGSALAVVWPAIYTSSNSLPGQPDALLKFVFDNSSLLLQSTVPVEGEIYDLAATDLNQDNSSELLVTVRRNDGIYIDVMEAF